MLRDFFVFLFWLLVLLAVRYIIRKRIGREKGEPTFEWLTLPESWKRKPKETLAQKKDEDSDNN
jgi:hypothetical protein